MNDTKNKFPLVVVCGPTATGKTSLAVDLALQFEGEILSVDSRQVYRGLDLGTGKDLDEYDHHKHPVAYHLIDIADPRETYSLYHYIEDFYRTLRTINENRHLPIACGGTGLYLEAVLQNYRVANVSEDQVLRDSLMKKTREELQETLEAEAPDLFTECDLSSKKRIVRSIEIARYREHHEVHFSGEDPPLFSPLILAVRYPREELLERINLRLKARLDEGMIAEVEGLLAAGVSADRLISLGMEYKFLTEYVLKKLTFDEMVSSLQTAIHRLAKRQMTWYRGMERRGLKLHWLDRGDPGEAKKLVQSFLPEEKT